MRQLARTIFFVVGLSLAGCASTTAPGSPTESALEVQQKQVAVEAAGVDAAAVAAKAAYDAGYIKPGSELEGDITIALHAGQAAVNSANASLKAGDLGSAAMYLGQAAAAIGQIAQDISKAKLAAGVTS